MIIRKFWTPALLALGLGLVNCAHDVIDGDEDSGDGDNGTNGDGDGNEGDGDLAPDLTMQGTGGTTDPLVEGSECEGVVDNAEPRLRPQDIIIVVDSSGSMDEEMQEIEARINESLAQKLQANGIDYRIIVLARYGESSDVTDQVLGMCFTDPLGGHDCSSPMFWNPTEEEDSEPFPYTSGAGAVVGTQELQNSERFFHHSEYIDSHQALCQILDRFYSAQMAEEHGPQFSSGWSGSVREEAFKNFIVFSDDRVNCEYGNIEIRAGKDSGSWEAAIANGTAIGLSAAPAAAFDAALLDLSPLHFGTAEARNYRMYSIVGLDEHDGGPLVPYQPGEPLETEECTGNANEVLSPGLVYQQLSLMTGGLRYPICQNRNFDAIFDAVAEGVSENAKLGCEWEIPPVPEGQSFDRDRVNVIANLDGTEEYLLRVDEGACSAEGGWYYDQPVNPTHVLACPSTCARFKAVLDTGSVELQFGCETRTVVVR